LIEVIPYVLAFLLMIDLAFGDFWSADSVHAATLAAQFVHWTISTDRNICVKLAWLVQHGLLWDIQFVLIEA
jgi:hypothetical protein